MLTRRKLMGALVGVVGASALMGCSDRVSGGSAGGAEGSTRAPQGSGEMSKNGSRTSQVYFTRDTSPEGLQRAFDALGVSPEGNVAVKLSTGEPGGHNFLSPDLIAGLVQGLRATCKRQKITALRPLPMSTSWTPTVR